MIFPSPDQLDDLQRIDAMVGVKRPLLVVNPQYRRPADFGFFKKGAGEKLLSRYAVGYAFEEFACRGESVKLTCDRREPGGGGWRSFCVIGEDAINRKAEGTLLLHDEPLAERPAYDFLEARINEVLPDPAWMRAINKQQQ